MVTQSRQHEYIKISPQKSPQYTPAWSTGQDHELTVPSTEHKALAAAKGCPQPPGDSYRIETVTPLD